VLELEHLRDEAGELESLEWDQEELVEKTKSVAVS
jgi:hypothetical protein